ncbi:MAG TPA: alcohol dehydrogenase catalytic domain-containing protein, partial [Solirubrobacter sp.]
MRATMLRSFAEPLTLETVADPACGDDGVVVQVRATGVCRSDWHAWMGHDPSIVLPHVPGHELCGVVAEVGASVRGWAVGDRVTVPFCCGCGVCEPCRLGETQICDQDFQPGFTAWGSFAEFVALPRADLNLVAVPESLSDVEAASLGCRFMTAWAALHVHTQVRAGEWVAVHGCGGVGLAAVMIAAAAGARVVAVDIDAAKLERARGLGAEAVVSGDDVVGSIRDVTGGGAHVSL